MINTMLGRIARQGLVRAPRSAAPRFVAQRSFSGKSDADSDPDFMPEQKASLGDTSEVHDFIDSAVKEHRTKFLSSSAPLVSATHSSSASAVLLFMKGTPEQPQCGFSSTVVQILKSTGTDFASADVLSNPLLREGIKSYSEWPTVPQLYVAGEFIGGCDIVTEMYEKGELEKELEKSKKK